MKILIVDDEAPARGRLANLVRAVGGHEVVGEAANGAQAVSCCSSWQPEIVLMDIRMPGMDGLEAAARLSHFDQPPAVIFVTAYGDHALAAFESAAIDYLVKPVRRERLATALSKARRLNRAQFEALQLSAEAPGRRHILCRRRRGVELVPIANVQYFKADQKYVIVRHADGEDLIEDSLRQLEEEFGRRFVRIHRKMLVARLRLAGLEKSSDGRCYAVLLDSDERLEVSRRHLPQVRGLLRGVGG
ncbi:MAG: LytTR family DNA-binding domain-containing protein [Nitrococcus sp.]|nr:LytTR family DNA-binding domain-containing protein [Nitrococcus sp.]